MATTDTAPDPAPEPTPEESLAEVHAAAGAPTRRRHLLIDTLLIFTAVLSLFAMVSIWANRLLFNPDNWENASTQLLENPAIRGATANYLVTQLYDNVDVAGLIKSGLPTQLQPLAGPAAGALRNVAVQGTEAALSRPLVQDLWAKANRAADQTFIAIANGGKGPVGVNNGTVTLDLGAIVGNVAAQLGLPSDLASKLPPSVAHLTVFHSDQLSLVQDVGQAIKGLALWLTILVPALYVLALVLSKGFRRQTLLRIGCAITFSGVVGVAGRHVLQNKLAASLTNDEALRPAIRATLTIATQLLEEIAVAFILVGIVVIAAAVFAGPARWAVASRRAIAPFLREHPGASLAVTALIMLLVFIWNPIPATGTPVGIVVFLAMAFIGEEVLRRQTAVEFPDAQHGDATAAMRERMHALTRRHPHEGGSGGANESVGTPEGPSESVGASAGTAESVGVSEGPSEPVGE